MRRCGNAASQKLSEEEALQKGMEAKAVWNNVQGSTNVAGAWMRRSDAGSRGRRYIRKPEFYGLLLGIVSWCIASSRTMKIEYRLFVFHDAVSVGGICEVSSDVPQLNRCDTFRSAR